MDIHNHTPFPAVAWENVDADKQWHITTLIRVKYILSESNQPNRWVLKLTPNQGELFGEDIYFKNVINQPVRYESDFVTYKPNTDIIINANTYSPDGIPSKQWMCGVEVLSPDKDMLKSISLKVTGSQHWEKLNLIGWTRGEINKVSCVPVRYSHAYGGSMINPDAEDFGEDYYLAEDENNPVGTGIRHKKMPTEPFPAHQIEWQDKALKDEPYPAGLGFINRAWKYRLQYAGTYDKTWIDEQHPYPPHDFNYQHHQAANPELILDGYIEMGSEIQLNNLLPETNSCRFKIPELYCFTEFHYAKNQLQRKLMNIDTVLIDIDQEEKAVYLSYRHFTPKKGTPNAIHLCYLPKEQLEKQS